jgi:CheY-like chemotaxis protein
MTQTTGSSLPVLIIDDDSNGNQVIADHLRFRGYEPISQYSGPAALEYLKTLPEDRLPRVILLDVLMPGMNGCQVLHELRHNEPTRRIPIIMLSVLSQDEVKDQISCPCDGYNNYIRKPFEMSAIVNLLTHYIHG